MQLQLNIFIIVILLGSIQGILFSTVLVKNKNFDKKSNLFLALFLICFSLSNLHYCFLSIGLFDTYPWLEFLSFPWTFLIPPSFYFFIRFLIDPNYKMTQLDKWMFLPFFIQTIFHLSLFIISLSTPDVLVAFQETIHLWDFVVEEILAIILCVIFIPIIYQKIQRYENALKDNYSEISKHSLMWLKNLLILLLVIWLVWAASGIYHRTSGFASEKLDYLLWILMSISIYWIGYATYSRNDIFWATQSFPSLIVAPTVQNLSINTKKYYSIIIQVMEEEKLFTNPNFDLAMLAERCDISPNYLSQIINKKSGLSFYDFINHYRIEEVKKNLLNTEFADYSILGIGLEAGFKSKSTFYHVFKKSTGMTPSAFQKQAQ